MHHKLRVRHIVSPPQILRPNQLIRHRHPVQAFDPAARIADEMSVGVFLMLSLPNRRRRVPPRPILPAHSMQQLVLRQGIERAINRHCVGAIGKPPNHVRRTQRRARRRHGA